MPLQRAATGAVHVVAELRYRSARIVRGDRPLVVMLFGALGLAVVLLSGPAQSYLEARDRVESLEVKAAALDGANERLQQRVEDLEDPLTVELLAREEQGFVRPGEVPYTLVPPEVDRPRVNPTRSAPTARPDAWYERVWAAVGDWVG